MYKLVVLSCVLALAAAKPSGIGFAGLGLGAHWGAPFGAAWAAPLAAPVVAAPALAHAAPLAHGAHAVTGVAGPTVVAAAPLHGAAYNYRGPVSLAPGQPASLLATDGRPLDTLSVNVDRAVHYTARAVDAAAAHGVIGHHLGKRSAPLVAPAVWGHAALAAPLAVPAAAHLGWRAPIGHLGWGPAAHAGVWGHHW